MTHAWAGFHPLRTLTTSLILLTLSGGVSLALEPDQIRLGDVMRKAESNLRVVECFDAKTNTCPIIGVCNLKPVLAEALDAFLAVLDRYTLADLLDRRSKTKLAKVFANL